MEVVLGITTRPLYKKRIEKFVLWSYEMHLQNQSFAQLSYLPKISTDHVMPQELKGDWRKVIAEDAHKEAVHLWGNLIPFSDKENSCKGSKSYEDARARLAEETAFLTTKKFLTKHEKWDEEGIRERTHELANWALSRWPK